MSERRYDTSRHKLAWACWLVESICDDTPDAVARPPARMPHGERRGKASGNPASLNPRRRGLGAIPPIGAASCINWNGADENHRRQHGECAGLKHDSSHRP